jgi:hypothetical protein
VITFSSYEQPRRSSYYFLVGHGSKAIACWTTGDEGSDGMMACGGAPSKEGIDVYKVWCVGADEIDG